MKKQFFKCPTCDYEGKFGIFDDDQDVVAPTERCPKCTEAFLNDNVPSLILGKKEENYVKVKRKLK